MKLKYFIPSLVAVVAAMFTSCSDDKDATYLDGLRVSQSYVALPTNGGSTSIEITAKGDWTFTESQTISITNSAGEKESISAPLPDWISVDGDVEKEAILDSKDKPTAFYHIKGHEGKSTITFSADAAEGRTAQLLLTCGDLTQRINIIQGIASVETATCAEVLAGPEAKTYRVTGVCVDNPDNQYGNWHIDDGTGNVYVYGTLDKKGNKGAYPISGSNGWGFGPGDVVTIEGPKTIYNGTVELVDVTVIKIVKSLVKIEEGDTQALSYEGGNFTVRLNVSGDGPSIKIADDAMDWLSIKSVLKTDSTTNVVFHVAANDAEQARTGVIEFTSKSGSSSSTVKTTVSQGGLIGTLTNPFTVAQALEYCKTLSGETANDFYIKGKISKIENNGQFGSYGNATFCISDDGEYQGSVNEKNKLVPDQSHDFECYRVLWLGNKKWADGNAQISEGDEVIIHGKLTLYNGIAETSGNKAYIYQINGVQSDANGIGSLTSPFNIAGAMAAIDNGWKGDVYVAGKVSKIHVNKGVEQYFTTQYGNASFWISDDGVYNDDLTKDFEAYQVYYLGNKKWAEGDTQIAVGDQVIIHGQLTKYNNTTYETAGKKAYIYSLNGVTE